MKVWTNKLAPSHWFCMKKNSIICVLKNNCIYFAFSEAFSILDFMK